jgi:di/tricarboxylate transporter
LYRAALWIAAHAPGGFLGQVTTLSLAGVGLGAAIPDSVARTSLVAPATLEMADALGHPPGSRAAAGLAMAVQVGLGQVVALFLTSSSTALLAYALLPETARSGLTWGTWALRAAPVHVIMLLGLIVAIVFLYRPPPPTRLREVRQPGSAAAGRHAQRLALQRALLGKPSRQEYIAGGVAILLVVGFVTQPLHNVNPTWVAVTAFLLLAATGVLTADTLRSVNWNFVVLFGVLTSMSGVFAGVGLDRWLGDIVAQLLGPLAPNPVLFVAALAMLCFGLNLVVRLPAAAPLVTLAVAPVAGRVGIDPWIVVIVALTACNGFFLSHQSNAYQALYSGTAGRLFSHSQARPLAIAYYVVTLLALCASVPVWHAMGLL